MLHFFFFVNPRSLVVALSGEDPEMHKVNAKHDDEAAQSDRNVDRKTTECRLVLGLIKMMITVPSK